MIFLEKLLYVELEVEESKLEDVLLKLSKWGFFHLDERERGHRSPFEGENLIPYLETVAEFLNLPSISPPRELNLESLKPDVETLYRQILSLKEEVVQLKREKELLEVAAKIDGSFDFSVSDLVEKVKSIPFRVGVLKKEVFERLVILLKSERMYALFSPLGSGEYSFLIFSPLREEVFENIKSSFGIGFVPLKYFKAEVAEGIKVKEQEINREIEKIKEQYGEKLSRALAFLKFKREISEVIGLCKKRGMSRVLKGWIPEIKKDEFVELFKGDCKIVFHPPGENPPSLVKTPSFLKPIEDIVFSYSYPSYYDINPVFPFVVTFVFLFGIMFGDVGHGLMLALLGIFIEKKNRRAIGRLMLLSGISSAFFGFLYGSVFGKEVFHPVLFSPMRSVELLLVFSFVVGIVVMTAGFVLKFFSSVRRDSVKQILFDEEGLLSFAIYWLSLGILVKAIVLRVSVKVDFIILLVMLLVSTWYAYKKTKQVAVSFIDAVRMALENLVNTLSFMRLGAFALAHGALFFAIFTVAESVKVLKGGVLIYWMVVFLGNLLIVALEGLVVTIQALRLNYYEFFKKFYRGGGKPFKPFRLEEI